MKRAFSFVLACSSLAFWAAGCDPWLDPLPDNPENLRIAVATVALKSSDDAAPFVTPEQAEKTVREASEIWSQYCGISFKHVGHFEHEAGAFVPYRAEDDIQLAELQYKFAKDHYVTVVFAAQLQHSFSGEDEFVGGIAGYPDGPRKAVLMAAASRNIFAHEMGHFMNLPHVADDDWVKETPENDPMNLMFPGDFGDSIDRRFVLVQCQAAKNALLQHAGLRDLCRPDSSDPELSRDNCPGVEL